MVAILSHKYYWSIISYFTIFLTLFLTFYTLNGLYMFSSPRAQIGETTDTLNQLEGDLTAVQDSNYEASNALSTLEREAKELNLNSDQLNRQLDILKNSNFLG